MPPLLLTPLLVVHEKDLEDDERGIFWSRAIESDQVGYQVNLFQSVEDIAPYQSIQVGDTNSHALAAEHAAESIVGISTYKIDSNAEEKSSEPNSES